MKRIILYRYHENVDFSIDRLTVIKKLNPEVPVYGLYGGDENEFDKYEAALASFFEDHYCIRSKPGFWKWGNSDLAYRLWYKDMGHLIDFDSVVVIEWDLVFLEPIEKIYSHVMPGQLGMTGLTPLSKVEKKWFWTRDPAQRQNWLNLLEFVKHHYNYQDSPYASLCPGVILPKQFLEQFSKLEVPELGHDELRLPLFAQVLGYELVDLGFSRKWFSASENQYFNCNDIDILPATIEKEYSKRKGRRVFHPFRDYVTNVFPEFYRNGSMVG